MFNLKFQLNRKTYLEIIGIISLFYFKDFNNIKLTYDIICYILEIILY